MILSVIELELLGVEPLWGKEDNKLNFTKIGFRVTVRHAGEMATRELNTQVYSSDELCGLDKYIWDSLSYLGEV